MYELKSLESFTIWQIPKILSGLACWIFQFAIILFGIWLLYAGIMFILSRGNPTGYAQAKKTFLYSLLGGLIIYGVYTIILTVAGFLEIANLPWIPLTCP